MKEALDATGHAQTSKIAASGRLALQMLEYGTIDVVIMQENFSDIPIGDWFEEFFSRGFGAHVIVMSGSPAPAARAAKDRLKSGHLHFIESPTTGGTSSELEFKRCVTQISGILEKIMPAIGTAVSRVNLDIFKPHVICIGASTGGPAALEVLFSRMGGRARVPILIVQHMPAGFTESLASRIQMVSGLPTAEAMPGEILRAGRVYVAPGDYHIRLVKDGGDVTVHLDHGPKRNSVRPCVDLLFETAAEIFGKNVFAMVMTGMGEDGLAGCRRVKKSGGAVVIQNKESSVVWGMPGAVHAAGCFDSMGDLERCADLLSVMSVRR